MARPSLQDFYQNFRFHLIDVTPAGKGLDLPLLALSPQIGFKSVTAPGFAVETTDIRPGNDPFPVSIPIGATVSNITLSRGVYTGDKEFYQWALQTINGRGLWRRDLLLMQIHPVLRTPDHSVARFGEVMGILGTALAQDAFGTGGDLVLTAGAAVANAGGVAIPDVFARIWKLYDCFPTGYRAASELDASDDGITIQELELHVERFEEIASGPNPISQGFGA